MILPKNYTHPKGDQLLPFKKGEKPSVSIDTFEGKVQVEWEPGASVTPMGQLPFFIQFLKTGYRFEPWVEDCPLSYTSNNAPSKTDVLGTFLLSMLSGHCRYAHITTLMNDGVNARLLGMKKVISDDSARRALLKINEQEGVFWLQHHLQSCYEPLLNIPWIMDVDTTVKPLYGRQEGAVKGYNPKKRGRPCHTYHSYMMANLKLMLDVEVQAGNEGSSRHSLPGLLALLERLPRTCWPEFIRGDCDFGNNTIMRDLEAVDCHYLFKVKKTRKVMGLIHRLHGQGEWTRYDSQWEGKVSTLQLTGWEKERRVVIVRRKLPNDQIALLEQEKKKGQQTLELLEEPKIMKAYEYSVLVTSMSDDVVTLIDHYRQRATCENNFDEIKNQWGWGGFTTRDIKRCRLIARMIALVYNWWSLFVRMSNPDNHKEAITSRPMLMSSVGRLTVSGRQKKMSLTSTHGLMKKVKRLQTDVSEFLNQIASIAPQLSPVNAWCRILTRAFCKYLQNGMVITPVPVLNSG